jgi:DNA polymerase III epsilon subunit-like protein
MREAQVAQLVPSKRQPRGTDRRRVRHDDEVPETEALISVDVEASGPTPSTGSLIAIGACRVDRPQLTFYRELRPQTGIAWDDRTESAHGLTREYLADHGVDPAEAIRNLADWIESVREGRNPVMVGVNVAFDWMFLADYLWRYTGRNPFGIAPLDLKSLFMGRYGVRHWSETGKRNMLEKVTVDLPHTHHALDDALMQARICAQLLETPAEPR